MRAELLGLTIACVLGCSDFEDALKTERPPVTPPGIAPVENGLDAADDGRDAAQPPADDAEQGFGAANVGRPNRGQGRSSIVGRKTRTILNAKEELKKPNVRAIKPDVYGNDPLTQYRTAYLKAASFAGSLPLQQWIRHHKVLQDRFPTYDELQAWMKENPSLQLPVLTGGRQYGYDEDSGEVVILEYQQQGE